MRIYLDVPYDEKNSAKQLGAKWDSQKRKWYFDGSIKEIYKFQRWIDTRSIFSDSNKFYFDVPISDIDIAKELGAKWDAEMKSWYYNGSPENYQIFSKWIDNMDSSSSMHSNFQETIKSLEDDLQRANAEISSLKTQINDLNRVNKELHAQSNQSASNEDFPSFSGCNTKDELHQRYKLLCKLLHPDNSQANLTKNFQIIQSQYNKLSSII